MGNYDATIDPKTPNSSQIQLAGLVGEDKHVLDVGCWRGDLGRVLRAVGCKVVGVDIDEAAAAKASAVLDEVVVADLDETPLTALFAGQTFDAVVFGDVLEHLKGPETVLKDAVSLLAPHGRIVISLPNVTHGALRLALLQGRWQMTPEGLLDETHIHFYSRKGLFGLLNAAGLQADELRGVILDPLGTEVDVDADAIPAGVVEWVRNQPDALVYQFLVSASAVPEGREAVHSTRIRYTVDPDAVRFQDQYTDQAVNAARETLRMRDHVLGLQAEATAAKARTTRETERKRRLQARLEKQNGQLARQRRRIAQLERQGFVGFLRRIKRKLAS